MNQLDTFEEKLLAKCGHGLLFSNDDDTTSPSLEPCSPKMSSSRVRFDPDGSDDVFWMYINAEVLSNSSSLCNISNS
jgi:hypothetical protein